VLASVERVANYGAHVVLDEYDSKQGMVPIREFSLKWVKNPRDYLKEGQKAVLKVIRVNPSRQHIDLSLKSVSENEKRRKIREFKQLKRTESFMSFLAKKFDRREAELYSLFGDPLTNKYGDLTEGLLEVSKGNEDLSEFVRDEEFRKKLIEIISEHIKPKKVSISGKLSVSSLEGNGLEDIKELLRIGMKAFNDDVTGSISYISAPLYAFELVSADYKVAEKALKESLSMMEDYANSHHIEFSFERDSK